MLLNILLSARPSLKLGRRCLLVHSQLYSTRPEVKEENLQKPPVDLLNQYNKNGFVIVRKAINSDLVSELQGHVAWLMKRFPELPPEHLHHPLIEFDAFWLRVVSEPSLIELAKLFIGDDVALFASHYFCKMPRTGQKVLWHQDGAYWPLKPMKVVSLWLAVDQSNHGNGCLRVVPGSHRQALKQLKKSPGANVLSSHTDVDVDESDVVNIELEPGDVEIHHPNIIHGSNANMSDHRRCGLTIRYIPTTTTVTAPPSDPIIPMNWLLHGKPVPGVNNYLSWPAFSPIYSYSFSGCDTWNQRPEVHASAVEHSKSLSTEDVKKISLGKAQHVVDGLKNA